MKPSLTALLQELDAIETTAMRRLQIGVSLEEIGDTRPGVGLKDDIPDIVWLPVVQGGQVEIKRFWWSDTPDKIIKITSIGQFNVEPFYIAKYLVTYAQYQAFVTAEDGFDNLIWWQGMPEDIQRQPLGEQHIKMFNHPRDNISWYQSVAFTRWLNHRLEGLELPHPLDRGELRVGDNAHIRLPTEWEWQWAAQNGVEARLYPWGERGTGYANTAESSLGQPTSSWYVSARGSSLWSLRHGRKLDGVVRQ